MGLQAQYGMLNGVLSGKVRGLHGVDATVDGEVVHGV